MKCKAIYFSAAVCFLAVLGMVLSLALTGGKSEQAEFTPPPFETAAQSGMPDAADVYFTNDDGNEVWLKLRILDEEDNILAETGLLKPNEYVRTVTFDTVPENRATIKLKIMAYEPDTYYSAGAVTLNTTVGG